MAVKHERQVLRQARMNREERDYTRRTRNAKLAALVTVETAELLERLVTLPDDYTLRQGYLDGEAARALAARIREALEVNDEG